MLQNIQLKIKGNRRVFTNPVGGRSEGRPCLINLVSQPEYVETVYFVPMRLFYTVLLLQLILKHQKKHQVAFWLPVTGSVEERDNQIDGVWCPFLY